MHVYTESITAGRKTVEDARAQGMAKIEATHVESEMLCQDTCMAIGKWKWYKADGELGGTLK